MPLSLERQSNSTDEYAYMIARYGNPHSRSEHIAYKARVPIRTAHYLPANVTVTFIANGCVTVYQRVNDILAEKDKYPALAQSQISRVKECSPGVGWTIVGYTDSSGLPISAESAATRLNARQQAADAKPKVEAQQSAGQIAEEAERKRNHEAYLKALEQPVDPRDPKVIEQRNYRPTEPESDLTRGCAAARLRLENKPISDLTLKQVQLLQVCSALGQ
jgi:hypothetical protein